VCCTHSLDQLGPKYCLIGKSPLEIGKKIKRFVRELIENKCIFDFMSGRSNRKIDEIRIKLTRMWLKTIRL
jgi:hypothetical protein